MHAQTRRQREVLDLIARYIDTHGYRPSYQVIARHLGLRSRAGIARIVNDLETQGLLTRRREEGHFHIDMLRTGETFAIPWLDVPAENRELEVWQNDPVWLPGFMIGHYDPETLRAYLVADDSMVDDNICEDDIALIELKDYPRGGEIVVAVLDKERTVLRKYYRVGAEIELRASEGCEAPITIPADQVKLIGIYRGLIRPAH